MKILCTTLYLHATLTYDVTLNYTKTLLICTCSSWWQKRDKDNHSSGCNLDTNFGKTPPRDWPSKIGEVGVAKKLPSLSSPKNSIWLLLRTMSYLLNILSVEKFSNTRKSILASDYLVYSLLNNQSTTWYI